MRDDATRILDYYAMMHGAYAAMPNDEKQSLEAWERAHLDGCTVATSDWPGWEKYIGPRPTPVARESSRPGYVYLVQAATGEFKIGISTNVQTRIAQLQTASPVPLTLLHYFPAKNAREVERELHNRFRAGRVRNEWFRLTSADVVMIRDIVER